MSQNELSRRQVGRSAVGGVLLLAALVIFAVVVGMRPVSIGTDTWVYVGQFGYAQVHGVLPPTAPIAPGFNLLAAASVALGVSAGTWMVMLAVAQALAWAVAIRGLAEYLQVAKWRRVLTYVCVTAGMLASPFLVAASLNVVRAGLAVPLALASVVWYFRDRKLSALAFGGLAIAMHPATAMIIAFALVCVVTLGAIGLRLLVAALSVLYALGWTSGLTHQISDLLLGTLARGASDVSVTAYRSGVRLDFLIAGLTFWCICIVVARGGGPEAARLASLSGALLIPFLLVGTIPYSDRLLLPFWLISVPVIVLLGVRRLGDVALVGATALFTAAAVVLVAALWPVGVLS